MIGTAPGLRPIVAGQNVSVTIGATRRLLLHAAKLASVEGGVVRRFRVVVVWRPLKRRCDRFRTWTDYEATSAEAAETYAAGAFAARGRIIENVTALSIEASARTARSH